jgi:hypothetical protein
MPDARAPLVYLIDTSVLVNVQDAHGDSEDIWERIIAEILGSRLKSVRQVMDELKNRFPKIHERIKPYQKFFLVEDGLLYSASVIAELRIIQEQHPGLYRPTGNNNSADPFLIAVAKQMGVTVVTDEKRQGPKHKHKIPWVCTQRNVGSIDGLSYLISIGCDL